MSPDPRADTRIVLITGAGSGIGRALALRAAADGAFLVLVGRRADKLDETARLAGTGAGTAVFPMDVTSEDDCRRLTLEIEHRFGRLDVLVNNAGVVAVGPVEALTADGVDRLLRTNLGGPINLTRHLLPLLNEGRRGQIVNVGSMLGDIGLPLFAAYSATKFGLRGWSDALRRELRPQGIRVSYAAPRATRTDAATAFDHLIEPFAMKVDAPAAVAGRIWRLVRRGRGNLYPVGMESVARVLQAVAPRLVDLGIASQLRRVR